MTIADVARAAGVSQTSVSYALNAAPGLSAATRRRVQDAAAALGYTPSSAARALPRGHDDTVVCILPEDTSPELLPLAVLVHLAAELEQHELTLILRRRRPGQSLAATWRERSPAAVLVLDPPSDADANEAADAHVVLVPATCETSPGPQGDAAVLQRQVSALQVGHLVERGHHHLAFVTSTAEREEHWCRARRDEVLRESLRHGLHLPEVVDVTPTPEHAADLVRRWRKRTPRITGVVAADDEVACAVLEGLRLLRLTAPDDLAVVGVGGNPLASLTTPPLTTVTVDHRALALRLLVRLLSSLGRTATSPSQDDAPVVSLVTRSST